MEGSPTSLLGPKGSRMKLVLAWIGTRQRSKLPHAEALTTEYLERCNHLCPTDSSSFPTEAALLASAERQPNRPAATLLLFDSRGDTLTSEQFAELLGRLRDNAAQRVLLAIGPADGWSPAALARAHRVLSLGRMTLPHELARVVVAEQIYRALTILAGHPYHSGH